MINANELRIGNWVEHNNEWSARQHSVGHTGSFYFQWEESDWYAISECTLSLENIEPIPIAPEILQQCGFDEDLSLLVNKEMDLRYDEDSKSVTLWAHFDYPAQSIQFLHQLQNLYFALTGEELAVNNAYIRGNI